MLPLQNYYIFLQWTGWLKQWSLFFYRFCINLKIPRIRIIKLLEKEYEDIMFFWCSHDRPCWIPVMLRSHKKDSSSFHGLIITSAFSLVKKNTYIFNCQLFIFKCKKYKCWMLMHLIWFFYSYKVEYFAVFYLDR